MYFSWLFSSNVYSKTCIDVQIIGCQFFHATITYTIVLDDKYLQIVASVFMMTNIL